MFYVCVQKIDVMRNFEIFWKLNIAIDSRTVLVGSGSTERAVDARRHADQRPHRATE